MDEYGKEIREIIYSVGRGRILFGPNVGLIENQPLQS